MIFSTLVIKTKIKKYIILSTIILIFSLIYEMFSHGVYSNYMLLAFLFPLFGGVVIYSILLKNKNIISGIGMNIYDMSLITIMIGSIIKGVLEIYGTTNSLIMIYWLAGILLLMISIIFNIKNIKKTQPVS